MMKIETHTGKSHDKRNIKISVSHVQIPGTVSKKRFMDIKGR